MERSHTPLNVWFWAAYLVASQTPGMSAVQFQRQLGLSRYETAFQILHKLRSGMVRPNQDRIGGQPKNVNGGAKMPHARRPGGPVAAAQKCATYGPLSVLARGGGCTAWSSMRRFGWRLSMRG